MNLDFGRIWKLIVGPFLIPVAIAAVIEAFLLFVNGVPMAEVQWATYGFAAYAILFPFIWSLLGSNLGFMETLEHESIHAIVAAFFLLTVWTLKVDEPATGTKQRAGKTEIVGGNRLGFWIDLSPYFLPILTLFPLLLHPFSSGTGRIIIDFVIGFTFGFHLIGVLREFGSFQTDIRRTTYVFALSLVVIMNALFIIIIVAVLIEDFALITNFAMATFDRTMDLYETGWRYAQQVLDGVTLTG